VKNIDNTDENADYFNKKVFQELLFNYLKDTFFSFKMPVISEIINNEVLYKEICKVYNKEDKKDTLEEKKNYFSSVSIFKFLFKYIKENIRENFSYNNNTFAFNNQFHNRVFLDDFIKISNDLSHEIYNYSNLNYEAENKLCMMLYLIKQMITKYPLFFKKTDLEDYIKGFKKFKK